MKESLGEKPPPSELYCRYTTTGTRHTYTGYLDKGHTWERNIFAERLLHNHNVVPVASLSPVKTQIQPHVTICLERQQ